MSATANWSYQNTATIRPFVSIDEWSQQSTYGEEYDIACTWTAVDNQERMTGGQSGSQGAELVLKHEIFTEDARPKALDLVLLNGAEIWEEIRSVTSWDMSFFGETPDFKLVTG